MRLLSGTGNSRPEPVGIGKRSGIDDMDGGWVNNGHGGQDVSNRVQNPKAFVDGNFKYGRCWINRAVHRSDAFTVPPPAVQKCSFAAGPRRCVDRGVETPRNKLVAAKRRWKRRHV
jgi:hypothetical protein